MNVNLYEDSQSQVRRHSDDEQLFLSIWGIQADRVSQLRCWCSFTMETSSVSFAPRRGRHVAFLDGSAQDELLHQTDPGLESQRII